MLLILIISLNYGSFASIVDIVPTDSKLYSKISFLINKQIITDFKTDFSGKIEVSRYDFADTLIEPTEKCVAIAAAQAGKELSPAQRRRSELLTNTLTDMKSSDADNVIENLSALTDEFSADIEQLSPGLPERAKEAFKIIKADKSGFWQRVKNVSAYIANNIHVSISTSSNPNSLSSPIHFTTADLSGNPTVLLMSNKTNDKLPLSLSLKTATSLEASLDIAINRALLYGSLSSIPSKNPMDVIIPDGNGKAMVGVKYDIGTINNFDIVGIFELHIMRTGESGNRDIKTGAVGGIGLKW
ncbi:MAG: hypothetical protein WCO98_15945 [bacterium]